MRYLIVLLFMSLLLAGCDNTRHSIGVTTKPFSKNFEEGTKLNYNDWWVKKELNPETPVSDYADCFAPVMALVNQSKVALNFNGFNTTTDSAYQFDAIKFGIWLKDNYCIPRGVKYIQEDIKDISKKIKSADGSLEEMIRSTKNFEEKIDLKILDNLKESIEDTIKSILAFKKNLEDKTKN